MKLDLKIYRSYANEQKIVVSGHLLKKEAPQLYESGNRWRHALSVIQMFQVKTIPDATITFKFRDLNVTTKTMNDGRFRITIPYHFELTSGWHTFKIHAARHNEEITGNGEFVKPYPGEYGVISDIDDTFLVSHSGNILKKLYVMLTKNVNKRKVFKDAVAHYRLLNNLGRQDNDTNNAFFYVSSSEWNLYNFITRFTKIHEFPKAVLELKDIKTGIADFLFSGGGNHHHKFYKVKDLVEFYPELRFVLLGDDSQKDAFIYQDICNVFPLNISTVYIRQTGSHKKATVQKVLDNLQSLGIKVCYFKNSHEAMQHTLEFLG